MRFLNCILSVANIGENPDYEKIQKTKKSKNSSVSNHGLLQSGYLIFIIICVLSANLVECQELPKNEKGNLNLNRENIKKISDTSGKTRGRTLKKNKLKIHNFSIPRNDPKFACLRMEASLYFETKYMTNSKNGSHEKRVNFTLNDLNNFKYFGTCSPNRNLIEFRFLNDWNLKLYFYKQNQTFIFNHVVLYYKFTDPLYPNANHNGAQAEIYDKTFINTSLTNSFVCKNGLRIDLGAVVLNIRNLRVEPFFSKRESYAFDAEQICPQDNPPVDSTSTYTIWLTIIIVGIIVICFILFIVFRVSSGDDPRTTTTNNKKDYNNIR